MVHDLWTVIIYKLKGYKVHGQPRTGSGVSLRILFPPKREWLCKQVESGNTTAKKASIFSHNWLVRYSEANAEPTNASFTWTLFPCYSMWYMHYALWMGVCVCLCVYFYSMCSLASGLALSRVLVGQCSCDVTHRAPLLGSVSLCVTSFLCERASRVSLALFTPVPLCLALIGTSFLPLF